MLLNQIKMILLVIIFIEFYIICLMYVLHTILFILLDYVQIIAENILFIFWIYELYYYYYGSKPSIYYLH